MRRSLFVLAITASLCAALAPPASAGSTVERPHKGTEVGTSSVVIDETCVLDPDAFTLTCSVTTASTVRATHLGRSAVTTEGSITLFLLETCTLLDGQTVGTVFRANGISETVTASGDRVFGSYENEGCAGPEGTESIGTALVGSQAITGGTGRFEGATGSTTVDAKAFGDVFELAFEGTITY